MDTNQVLIYGIGGADKMYRVLEYYCIFDTSRDIVREIWNAAARLKAKNPSIQHIYIIDNRRGLKRDYQEAVRGNSIESFMLFKDILEREGREIQV